MTDSKPEGGVYSLDDLDKILNKEDPGFNESLESIKKEAIEDTSSIESLQVDSQVSEDSDEESEKGSWKRKIITVLLAPFVRLKNWFQLRRIAFLNRFRLYKELSIQFIKHEFPDRLRYYRSQLIALFKKGYAQWLRFMALSRSRKIAFIAVTLAAMSAFYFLIQTGRGRWLPEWQSPMIRSFTEQGHHLGTAKGPDDFIKMFEAFPEIEISFLLSKIIVNLTPSAGSPKPMGAFQFFLGLDAKETAIEVKDREKEILDLIQREVEAFTYDEVMSPAGQVRMKSRIRDAINDRLNQGGVTRVYVSTMVTYH